MRPWDTELTLFLKVDRSLPIKVRKEMEAADRDPVDVAKHKMHDKGPNNIRTPNLVRMVQKNDRYESRKINQRHCKLAQGVRFHHQKDCERGHPLKYYVIWRGQFLSKEIRNNCLISTNYLLNKLKF